MSSLHTTLFFACLLATLKTFPLTPSQKLYSIFLGPQEATIYYQRLVQKALDDYEVAQSARLCVKQMNWVGPAIAHRKLRSFTASGGIWLNEELLKQLSVEEQTFIIYHEIAHYIYGHHSKMLLSGVIPSLLMVTASNKAQSYTRNITVHHMLNLALPLAACANAYTLFAVVKAQEKKADLVATRILIKSGKNAVVQKYMQTLQQATQSDIHTMNSYHITAHEKLAYISQCYNSLTHLPTPS